MMKINPSIAILATIILGSCTGQNVPVNPTRVVSGTSVVASAAATLASQPIFTDTPQTGDFTPVNTPGTGPGLTPVPSSSPDVSSLISPTAVSNPPAFIPDTGQVQPANNQNKKDKFNNFSIPVSGSSGYILIPSTGFPKGVRSFVGPQPSDRRYSATEVTLEIPSLGVKIPVVGVPKKDGTWDLSWLVDQAGWLEGTAFPSWNGNSVLTAHFYLASGLPGPFVNIHTLKYGDQVVVHAYGQKYIFDVQTNTVVAADDKSAMKHEEKSWLTLITCADYDEKTQTYRSRIVVRSRLVSVEAE